MRIWLCALWSLCLAAPIRAADRAEPTGRLNHPRHEHAAALLASGRVLVAGGRLGDFDSDDSAEVWTPSTGRWELTGRMAHGRIQPALLGLPDGRAMAIGGYWHRLRDGRHELEVLGTTELFDPRTGRWSAGPPLRSPRAGSAAIILASGRLLVAGGWLGNGVGLTAAEIWSPGGGGWEPAGDSAFPRDGPALEAGGAVLLIGGHSGTSGNAREMTSVELWRAGRFFPLGPVNLPALPSRGVQLLDGRLLTVWRSRGSVFDPRTGRWTETGDFPRARDTPNDALVALADGRVLHLGGPGGISTPADVDALDPHSLRWSPAAPLREAREQHTATRLQDGRVLVAGGWAYGAGALVSAELWIPGAPPSPPLPLPGIEPPASSWRDGPVLRSPRLGAACVGLENGQVVVAGGRAGDDAPRPMPTEILVPGTSTPPEQLPAPPTARWGGEAIAVGGGRVLVALGTASRYGEAGLAAVDLLDVRRRAWASGPPLDAPRAGATLTALPDGGALVVGGHATFQGPPLADALLWRPGWSQWKRAGTLATPRERHVAVALAGGRVLIFGGLSGGAKVTTAELWDPTSQIFSGAPSPGEAEAGVRLADGSVLAVGTDHSEVWEPGAPVWVRVGAPWRPGYALRLVALADGTALRIDTGGSSAVERFELRTARWSFVASLRKGREAPAVCAFRGGLVVAGGAEWLGSDRAPPLASVESWSR